MNSLKMEAEAIQVSIYCEIITQVLNKHRNLSLSKMLVFAYLIKKDRFLPRNLYTGNNTQNIVYKCISMLAGNYAEFCSNIEFILKTIHILIKNDLVFLEDGILYTTAEFENNNKSYKESMFIEKAIIASKEMSDKQFLKEVIQIV